jgi:hypothetical protein
MDRDDFTLDMDIETALATTDDVEETAMVSAVPDADAPAAVGTVVFVDEALEPGIPATSRKIRRRGRRTRMRSKTIAMKRLTKEEIRLGALMYPPIDEPRPQTRSECLEGQRPCPWVSCKHHLYLDVNPETGSIKLNFPDLEVWDMKDTCSLDVADRNGITLEEVGEIMNLTRERIRQVEVRGLLKLKMMTTFGSDDD